MLHHDNGFPFETLNPIHPIQDLTFFCEFKDFLTPDQVARVLRWIRAKDTYQQSSVPTESLLKGFYTKEYLTKMPLEVDMGIKLEWYIDGEEKDVVLEVTPKQVIFRVENYTRWHEILPRVNRDFISLLNEIKSQGVQVESLGIRYINRFNLKSGHDYALDKLLNTGCKYTPKYVFTGEENVLWNFESSWPSFHTLGNDPEELGVKNELWARGAIDSSDQTTFVSFCFNQAAFIPESSVYIDKAIEIFQFFHDENERFIKEFLTFKACKRIGLSPSYRETNTDES
jgi:uncharacterized protein (TIGR04255 family)